MVTALYQHRWNEALAEVEAASHLPSTYWYGVWAGVVLWGNGRLDEAAASFQRALDLDPLSGLARYLLARYHNYRGQYDRAAPYSIDALEINPYMDAATAMLGVTYSDLGRVDEGVTLLEKCSQTWSQAAWDGYLCWTYVRAGRLTDAERVFAAITERSKQQYVSKVAGSLCAVAVGDTHSALEWLDGAVEDRDPEIAFIPGNPRFDPLRSQPRFLEIMKRANLPGYL